MKKLIAIALAVIAATPVLCACSTAAEQPAEHVDQSVETRETVPSPLPEQPAPPEYKSIEIYLDDGFTCRRSPISGIRRRFRNFDGVYTIEYVHTPIGVARDDTLSYDITINADNTYVMTVVSDGVTSDHVGRWYENFGGITFYFDEHIDPPAHNEYIADSMYAEMLPHGKLMIYDGGRTVVLSKSEQTEQAPNDNPPALYRDRSVTARI